MSIHRAWLAAATVLAACAGGCGAPDSGPGPAAPTQLVRGNGGEPGSLDPAFAQDIHAFDVLTDLYEGLVAVDASGASVPGVARAWTVEDDGRTYRFALRPSARWSNGDPVVADDFLRALRHVADPASASPYAFLLESIRNFSDVKSGTKAPEDLGVEIDGPHGLVIRLEQATPYFESILSMPIASPRHRQADASSPGDPVTRPTNGPYRLAERIVGNVLRLERNRHYWCDAATSIEEVRYLPIADENAELNGYRTGAIQVTRTIPPAYLPLLQRDRPAEVHIAPMLALYYVAFDLSDPRFADARLRQALSMAIDREQLVKLVGRGEIAAYGIVPGGTGGYAGPQYAWRELPRQDRIARARELYAAAGHGSGQPLALRYVYDAQGVHEKIALAVASMLEEALEVRVTLDKREWAYFLDTRDDRDAWDLMRFSWFGDYDDPTTFLDIFHSESIQNLPRYQDAEYDRLLDVAAIAVPGDERRQALGRAEQRLLDGYAIVPLYFYVSKHLVDPRLRGFEANPLDRHPSRYLRYATGAGQSPDEPASDTACGN